MTRTVLAAALAAALSIAVAAPVAAQSLTVLLPSLSFPEPVAAPSTKSCVADSTVQDCALSK